MTKSLQTDHDEAKMIEIRLAVPTDPLASVIVPLINQAYQIGERGILVDTDERPFSRVTLADIQDACARNTLYVAVIIKARTETAASTTGNTTSTSSIVGCIQAKRVDETTGEWGCLAVSVKHQELGIGRKLVQAAEGVLRNSGCQQVQLELLSPTHWKHAHKEMLREWYTQRIGYQLKSCCDCSSAPTSSSDENEKEINHYEASTTRLPENSLLGDRFLLATDADFTTYCKKL